MTMWMFENSHDHEKEKKRCKTIKAMTKQR